MMIINIAYALYRHMLPPFLKNKNPQSTLSIEQLTSISMGLIISEQRSFYCNTLETGGVKFIHRNQLSSYWGIYGKNTAIKKLDALKSQSNEKIYRLISPHLSKICELTSPLSNETNDDGIIPYLDEICGLIFPHLMNKLDEVDLTEEEKKELDGAISFIVNITDPDVYKYIARYLSKQCDFDSPEDFFDGSILSWDLGRLISISRICYELGYISESDAWGYIKFSHDELSKKYSSWKEFSCYYLLGRICWGGMDEAYFGVADIVKELLNHKDSPWQSIKFPVA